MKRFLLFLCTCMVCMPLVACSSKPQQQYQPEVQAAIAVLEEGWSQYYSDFPVSGDPYVEIKNTRIVFLKETEEEPFKGGDYIVEFVLFTNYYGSAPYYMNSNTDDSVIFYHDGNAELQKLSPFRQYTMRTFQSDFSDIIESVEDLGSSYNQTLSLS